MPIPQHRLLAALVALAGFTMVPTSAAELAATSHWSFQPRAAAPPPVVRQADWPRDPLDAFVLARIEAAGLGPTTDAPPRTLARRLHIDLVGLPPTVDELEAFEAAAAKDRDQAVADLVDRLLASPHFGERWGRHWLDVARYAESNGDDGLGRNATFPQAWRYRDYVIDALNRDTPFDRFLTEQIAGDLLPAKTAAARNRNLVATGFLAVGAKPAAAMNKNFAMDVADDQIDVVCTAVMGLSVACARCHDHKHDPITARDYYALAGIFTSTETLYGKAGNEKLTAPPTPLHALRSTLGPEPEPRPTTLDLPAAYAVVVAEHNPLLHEPLDHPPEHLACSDNVQVHSQGWATVDSSRLQGAFPETNSSYTVSFWFRNEVRNNARPITAYLFSRAPKGNKKLPGDHLGIGGNHNKARTGRLFVFNGNDRKESFGGGTVIATNTWNHVALVREAARVRVHLNGQPTPEIDAGLTPTFGANRQFNFAARSEGFGPLTGGIAQIAVWDRALTADELSTIYAASEAPVGPVPEAPAWAMGARDKTKPAGSPFYNKGLTPAKNDRVPRGFPAVHAATWKPPPSIPATQSGRLELARWLTQPDHPQTARVFVNRVWLHLFGQGIVDTPDDFGLYGAAPSHPELLDHLADRFVAGRWSIKKLIRAIVLSRSYQLDSQAPEDLRAADSDNRLFARHTRRRLDAETVRDSLLAVSGELDRSPGRGSAIQDVVQLINWPPGEATNFHRDSRHRSVYLCLLRHAPPPEIASFDLPDATCTLGCRNVSTLPTHSLYLLNSAFVVRQAEALAGRLADEAPPQRVQALFRRVLLRDPTGPERRRALAFVRELEAGPETADKAWSGLAQALMASNEFSTID